MSTIRFHGAILTILWAGALYGQPNPAAGPSSTYPASQIPGAGTITITLLDRVEIQSITDRSMRLTFDLELKAQRRVEVASMVFQDLRIDGVPVTPRVYIDTFTVDAKSQRKLISVDAPLIGEMYKWVKENRFGNRVPVDGSVLFNGREPGKLRDKPMVNDPASFRGQTPLLVSPGEIVLSDLKKGACSDRPAACEPVTVAQSWQQKVKELAQGRLVVLQATYTVDTGVSKNTVSVYRQGFRLPNGEIIGPTDLLDASKVAAASAPSGGITGVTAEGIESAVRGVLDRFLNGGGDKPPASGGAQPAPSPTGEVRVVAWLPNPTGADRVTIGSGNSYPVRLKKRLATADSGSNRSELGEYDFQGEWPAIAPGDVPGLGALSALGECIHVRLDGVPQTPTSGSSSAQAVAGFTDLPSIRPMGVMAGLGVRTSASYFGSVVMNRDGRFVAIVNSDDTGVTSAEIERALNAAPAPDPRPVIAEKPVVKEPATFEFRVESSPAGANVYVDGQLQFDGGKPALTPVTLHLSKKTYTFTISKTGYSPLTRELPVEGDRLWQPTLSH
jgi:hypothetical protein